MSSFLNGTPTTSLSVTDETSIHTFFLLTSDDNPVSILIK